MTWVVKLTPWNARWTRWKRQTPTTAARRRPQNLADSLLPQCKLPLPNLIVAIDLNPAKYSHPHFVASPDGNSITKKQKQTVEQHGFLVKRKPK
mmetsp:Transcript_4153/g.9160  ORF Transcript_4153/g.9160 Transcript_4153/m.9160 type:complete len:94 (-) Transcript_4153:37-318(-)